MTTVNIASFSLDNWIGDTDGLTLNIVANSYFVDSNQINVQEGWEVILVPVVSNVTTVDSQTSSTLTIPSFQLYSTTDAYFNQGATYSAIWKKDGQPYLAFEPLSQFRLGTTVFGFPNTAIQDIIVDNNNPPIWRNDIYGPNMVQFNAALAAATAGGTPATTSSLGIVKLSSISSTPTQPVVVETSDPRIPITSGNNDKFIQINSSGTGYEYRSFGNSANTVCEGDDSRLSDSRTPTGTAGGDLSGPYPNPVLNSIYQVPLAPPPSTSGDWAYVFKKVGLTETHQFFPVISNGSDVTVDSILGADDPRVPKDVSGGDNKFLKRKSGNTEWQYVGYGTSANTVCEGNDSRLSDSRIPTGSAGGDLTGTYPNPTISKIQSLTLPSVPSGGDKTVVNTIIRTSGVNSYSQQEVVTDGVTTSGILGAGDPRLVTSSPWSLGDFVYSYNTSKTGFLLCNGQAVSRTTYSSLFGVIGTTFGAGDGSTTFNVPDFRGRTVIGVDGTYTAGQTGGSANVTLSSSNLPSHYHFHHSQTVGVYNVADGSAVGTYSNFTTPQGTRNSFSGTEKNVGYAAGTVGTSSVGSGTAFSTLPPYIAAGNWLIYSGV